MAQFRDLVGEKFGRWVVQEWTERRGTTQFWQCKCDCGTIKIVNGESLKKGLSKSCGCLAKNWCRTHGMNGTPIYNVWAHMKGRCSNPKNIGWKHYGGRGISVCERWMKFENFYADMGKIPDGKTLDRMDNDGPYSPENCRWATEAEQKRNTRVTRFVEWEGVRMSVADFADKFGLTRKIVIARLDANWPAHQLNLPRRVRNRWHGGSA
jgi:hypothetical protein